MIVNHPRVILFIQPLKAPTGKPVEDEYTTMLSEVMEFVSSQISVARDKKTGKLVEKNKRWGLVRNNSTPPFTYHVTSKTKRRCVCGAESEDFDVALINHYFTTTLALHYLMWHREEVPEAELEKISLMYGNPPKALPDVKTEVKEEYE